MPADALSPIPAALTQLTHTDPRQLQDTQAPHLLAYLASVPDPRGARGRRHPLVAILGLAAAAVLAGARSIAAIAEWAADAPQPVRAGRPPPRPRLPRRPRRGHHPPDACSPGRRRPGQGDRRLAGRPAASRSRGQPAAGGRRRRQDLARRPSGNRRRPPGTPACGDGSRQPRGIGPMPGRRRARGGARLRPAAGPTRSGRGGGHRRRGADPPRCRGVPGHQQARPLPAYGQSQPAHPAGALPASALAQRARGRPHPRSRTRPVEIRTLKAVSVGHFGFPHAAQVLQVTRKTRDLDATSRRFRTVAVYALTSLPFEQASPARLADLLRRHWAIEALHYVRDVTFAEDASQVRTGAA